MSLAIGAQLAVIRASRGSSLAPSRWVSSEGLTSTRAATSSGRVSASRIARVPPIDSPATTTRSTSAASWSRARPTAVVQSSSVTWLQSCQRVPWPGSRGQRTANPAAARCSPHGRMLIGVPVKPCTSSTPVRPSGPFPPGKANGSAPGSTAGGGTLGPGKESSSVSGIGAGRGGCVRDTSQEAVADCDSALQLPSLAVHEGGVLFYWFLKFVALGPAVKLGFRPRAEGMENVPATGAAILASNHLSAADWIFMPLSLKRRVTFLAKAEYFTGKGVKGFLQRVFFAGS